MRREATGGEARGLGSLARLARPAAARVEDARPAWLALPIFALLAGSFDFLWGLVETRPGGLGTLRTAALAWSASEGVFLVLVALLAALVRLASRPLGDGRGLGFRIGATIFLVVFFVLGSLAFGLAAMLGPSLLTRSFWRGLPLVPFARICGVAVFSSLLAGTATGWLLGLGRARRRLWGVGLAYGLPGIVVVTTALGWARLYHVGPARSLSSPVLLALVLLAVAGLGGLSIRGVSRLVPAEAVAIAALLAPALVALAAGAGARTTPRDVQASAPAPTIVLISVDSLRWDALSCLAADAPKTPAIDRLARDGLLFRAAFSTAPWTQPAMGAALTGLSPRAYGDPTRPSRLPAGVRTLAERLRETGYRTAAFVESEWFSPGFGFDAGFDRFESYPVSFGRSAGARWLVHVGWPGFESEPSHRELLARAGDFLLAGEGAKRFAWIHVFDPHTPYEPPDWALPEERRGDAAFQRVDAARLGKVARSAAERRWLRTLYDAEVRDVDRSLGELFARLREEGLYDEALVILLSDHGEEFWDRGDFWHGHDLAADQIRVPLIVKPPGTAVSRVVDAPVSTGSVAPSILGESQTSYEPSELTFLSLEPYWRGSDPGPGSSAPSSMGLLFGLPRRSLVVRDLEYVWELESGAERWFRLRPETLETLEVPAPDPELVELARSRRRSLEEQEERLRRSLGSAATSGPSLDDESRRRLESLGYLD